MKRTSGYIYSRKGVLYIAYPDPAKKGGYRKESTKGNSKRDARRLLDKRLEVCRNRAIGWAETNASYKQHFIDFLKLYREGSETHKSYKGVLKLFIKFINEDYPHIQYLHEFGPKLFDCYRIWLKETKHKDWTVRNHLKVLKSVFKKAEEWEAIPKIPKINTAVTIEDEKPIKTLSNEEDFSKFFEVCKKIKIEYYPHYFIMVRTGLRYGEMRSLLWEHVNLETGSITVTRSANFTPKGRNKRTGLAKTRNIPLTRDAVEVLKVMPRSPIYKNVFLRHGKPFDKAGEKNLRLWLQKIAKNAGIEGMTRLHELRHTLGQQLYEKTRDLYVVKEILGHSELETTERYAGKPTKQAEEAMKKLEGFGGK